MFEVLAWYCSGGPEEEHKKPHDGQCYGRDTNEDPCKYKSGTLTPLLLPGEHFAPSHPSTPFI